MVEGPSDQYWENGVWLDHRPSETWRSHADWLHNTLLRRTILGANASVRAGVLLKTDLYEEAVGVGEIPELIGFFGATYGIDLSPDIVEAARRKTPSLIGIVADVRALPFRDASIDVVVSLSTLDHFQDESSIHQSLNEIARVLRPGGQALITLDNLANPLVRLRQALPFRWLNSIGVVPYFCGATLTPSALRDALEVAGLCVEETTCILHCPRVIAVAVARIIDRVPFRWARPYLRLLRRFEALEKWPSRYRTGYFAVAVCRRPVVHSLDDATAHPLPGREVHAASRRV